MRDCTSDICVQVVSLSVFILPSLPAAAPQNTRAIFPTSPASDQLVKSTHEDSSFVCGVALCGILDRVRRRLTKPQIISWKP